MSSSCDFSSGMLFGRAKPPRPHPTLHARMREERARRTDIHFIQGRFLVHSGQLQFVTRLVTYASMWRAHDHSMSVARSEQHGNRQRGGYSSPDSHGAGELQYWTPMRPEQSSTGKVSFVRKFFQFSLASFVAPMPSTIIAQRLPGLRGVSTVAT